MRPLSARHISYRPSNLLSPVYMKSRSVVRKANFQTRWSAGVALAGLIIGQMKKDGVIDASCPVPEPQSPLAG